MPRKSGLTVLLVPAFRPPSCGGTPATRVFWASKMVTAVPIGVVAHSPAILDPPRLKDGGIYSLAGAARVFALLNCSRWLLYDEGSLPADGDTHDYEVDARGRILSGGEPTGLTVTALTFTGWIRFDAFQS